MGWNKALDTGIPIVDADWMGAVFRVRYSGRRAECARLTFAHLPRPRQAPSRSRICLRGILGLRQTCRVRDFALTRMDMISDHTFDESPACDFRAGRETVRGAPPRALSGGLS
jgi:hypothetical protein